MELVIFDLDGVIISTDEYHYQAWKEISDKHGLVFNRNLNHTLRGVSRNESLKLIIKHNKTSIDDQTFNSLLNEKNNIYRNLLLNINKSHILEGTLELLADLKEKNIKIAIGSSSKNAELILRKIKLIDEFDIVIDGTKIISSKPDPEVFTKSADALNIKYENCLVFEDAEAGVFAAKAANMKVIGVGKRLEQVTKFCVDSLSELNYEKINDIFIQEDLK